MHFQTRHGLIEVNVDSKATLETLVRQKLLLKQGFALATINLDHLVKMDESSEFYAAYRAQDFVIADGNPIVWMSCIAGKRLDLLPGSDMVVPLAQWARDEARSIAFVGSTSDALDAAAAALEAKVIGLEVAKTISPEFGFDPNSDAAADILKELEESGVSLCFLALGAPKQEILAARAREIAPSVGFASIGAGLDFLAGKQKRAPRWVRQLALEWLWRLLENPKRMWKRYWSCALRLPSLLAGSLKLRLSSRA